MKKSSIFFTALLVTAALSLTSCLNDLEDFMGDFSSSPAIAELSESINPATGTVTREIINPTAPALFKLRVGIAVAQPLSKDIKVTLALDNAMITAYNTEKGLTGPAAAVPIPASALTIGSLDVIIPAGELEADWEFSVSAAQLTNPVTTFYVLPVKIASADNGVVVSGNFGTKLIRVLARNEFDGNYVMKGFIMRPGDQTGLEGWFKDQDYGLVTVGGSEVQFDRLQCWANGANVGGIDYWTIAISKQATSPYPITILDPVQGANFVNVPTYDNRYDVPSKTFYFSVLWGAASPKNRGCTDTLVFVGPRP